MAMKLLFCMGKRAKYGCSSRKSEIKNESDERIWGKIEYFRHLCGKDSDIKDEIRRIAIKLFLKCWKENYKYWKDLKNRNTVIIHGVTGEMLI